MLVIAMCPLRKQGAKQSRHQCRSIQTARFRLPKETRRVLPDCRLRGKRFDCWLPLRRPQINTNHESTAHDGGQWYREDSCPLTPPLSQLVPLAGSEARQTEDQAEHCYQLPGFRCPFHFHGELESCTLLQEEFYLVSKYSKQNCDVTLRLVQAELLAVKNRFLYSPASPREILRNQPVTKILFVI